MFFNSVFCLTYVMIVHYGIPYCTHIEGT